MPLKIKLRRLNFNNKVDIVLIVNNTILFIQIALIYILSVAGILSLVKGIYVKIMRFGDVLYNSDFDTFCNEKLINSIKFDPAFICVLTS